MCMTGEFTGNKVLVKTVGDLVPGERFRTPSGRELMVLDLPSAHEGTARVVDVVSGMVSYEADTTKLGTDRCGRLYASRSLNPAAKPVVVQPDSILDPRD